MKAYKYLIIGAGPTGLGAAHRLQELGETDFLVVEAKEYAGGLAASFLDSEGFTWDIGGHVQFSHYEYFDRLMDELLGVDGWISHQRESWAWMEDRFVPYPVQNNLRYLKKETVSKCLEGMSRLPKEPPKRPENFRDWIFATFGSGFAEAFMLPYNFKVWAYQPEKLSYHWIGERVSVVDYERALRNVTLEQDDVSWGPNNLFRFPKTGGTGSIWQNLAKKIGERIRLSTSISEIRPDKKEVLTNQGETIGYDYLLSTMPLNILCKLANTETPGPFVYSTTNIVGLGLKGPVPDQLKTKCWMYFPESNCPFYRATVFSNYSPNNVPDIKKYWSLMTETSESQDKPVNRWRLIEDTIQGCLNTKLIKSRSDVISRWSYTANHGYPTPFLGRDKILNAVVPALEEKGIYSRGRFGAWKYEVSNQDHSLMQGAEWANRVVRGTPEMTVTKPDVVNAVKQK